MRRLLVFFVCLATMSSLVAFAGGQKAAPGAAPAAPAAAPAVPGVFREAPMLAPRVTRGELPPVRQRLPENPLVIRPEEAVGTYGGTLRKVHRGPADSTGYFRMVREPLIDFCPMLQTVHPNIAESWEVSADGRSITFRLRRGLRWSDGHPFTADDVLFWWEVMNTTELFPSLPAAYTRGGQPATVTKRDDHTVVFTWTVPNAGFIPWLAAGNDENYMPKHYLSQFHRNYVDVARLTEMARAEGLENWMQLFQRRAGTATNNRAVGRPTMDAWILTNAFDAPIMISERNPFFWKVDTAGNQLPYIDFLHHRLVMDIEVMKLQLMAGEIDYITRHLWTTYGDLPLYTANQQRGDYRIIRTHGGTPGAFNIFFNVNFKDDPEIGRLMNNYQFKRALSHAIDRAEINDVRFANLGRPGHGHFHYRHPGFVESVDQAYINFDTAEANRILDAIGMRRRDPEGFRLRPDGQRLTLIIDGSTHHPHHAPGGELIKSYFEEIGIRTVINMMDRGLFESRRQANQHMMSFGDFADPIIPLLQTGHQITFTIAPLWEQWFNTGGRQGEEPSADAKRVMQIYRELAPATGDEARRNAFVREIAEIWGRNLWSIGTIGVPFNLSFAKNSLRNIPVHGAHSHPANPAIYRPCQWFWRR